MEISLSQLLDYLTVELTVMLTAALPVIELRGAIPVGISLGLTPIHATVLSFIGSMIPVPFILFTIRPIFNYLKTTRTFRKLVNKITDRSMKNHSEKIYKYGAWGLFILVAIPYQVQEFDRKFSCRSLNMRFNWLFLLFWSVIL